MNTSSLPVAVIGGGPVGLAAAAHLVIRGQTPLVLEAGDAVGTTVRAWGHVRFFSPWRYTIDTAARVLLEAHGWTGPDPDDYPTGRDLVDRYLAPLAATPEIAPHLRLDNHVVSVTRQGFDKMKTVGRDDAPFLLRVRSTDGREEDILARAVIDASGTWATPNPLGAGGMPAVGEAALGDRIYYGIPDVRGGQRKRYAGRRVLVVGSGHSAFNALADLVDLARQVQGTAITWAVRRPTLDQVFDGGADDVLQARGALGQRVRALVAEGRLRVVTGVQVTAVRRTDAGIVVSGAGDELPLVDEIIVTTGFRPDLTPLRELRVDLDPAVESPTALAPLIDPNVHSCGTVPPHGAEELAHPEKDVYIVGMKSYGRAPTFLLLTGYEQVRSVVAALTGDWAAARDVRLVLPDTGVCSSGIATAEGAPGAVCCGATTAERDPSNAQGIALTVPAHSAASIASTSETPAVPALVTVGAGGAPPLEAWPVNPLPPREAMPVATVESVESVESVVAAASVAVGADAHGQAACCAPSEQETCCDPSDKADCCGAAPAGRCGCR